MAAMAALWRFSVADFRKNATEQRWRCGFGMAAAIAMAVVAGWRKWRNFVGFCPRQELGRPDPILPGYSLNKRLQKLAFSLPASLQKLTFKTFSACVTPSRRDTTPGSTHERRRRAPTTSPDNARRRPAKEEDEVTKKKKKTRVRPAFFLNFFLGFLLFDTPFFCLQLFFFLLLFDTPFYC